MSPLSRSAWAWLLGVCVSGGLGQRGLGAEAPLTAEQVIQQAVERTQHLERASEQPAYAYTKVSLTEEFGADGKMREHREKVFQVSLRHGTTEVKLISVNGHPPAEADRKKQAENDSNARLVMGKPKAARDDEHEKVLTPELVARFDFTLEGRENLNGRPAYRLGFVPKTPEPPVHGLSDRLADRISGRIWIDTQEFEIARAELHLGAEVNLLGGVLGSLKRLAYTLNRTRIADGLWLKTSSTGDFEGRKLLDSLRIKTRSTSSDFHPLEVGELLPAANG